MPYVSYSLKADGKHPVVNCYSDLRSGGGYDVTRNPSELQAGVHRLVSFFPWRMLGLESSCHFGSDFKERQRK